MVTWSMAKQRATGHFDCVGILVRIRVRAAVPLRPSLLRSRGRDGLSPPPPVLAVVRLAAAVVLPVLVSPRVDEAAVVPLAAVALQEVLAGARLVLGVVVLGHPPALAVAAAVAVVPKAPAVSPEPSSAAATTAVELTSVVVAAAVVTAAVEAASATAASAPVEPVVVHVPGWGPAHVVRRRAMGRSVRWTVLGRTSVVTTRAWT